MKQLKLVIFSFLLLVGFSTALAQDRNNPWAFSFGVNAVDFYPVDGSSPQGALFSDFFNTSDHWNVIPGFSKLGVQRHILGGLSAKIDGSINSIEKYGDEEWSSTNYYSVNGGFTFNFADAVFGRPGSWIDPYVGLGLGPTWIDKKAKFMGQMEVGLNIWFNDRVGIDIGTAHRRAFNRNISHNNHFQHFVGLKIAFGGIDSDGDGIYDKFDECPDIPGLPEHNGCPDSDGDGIPDHLDECPDEPGLPEFNGCPDTDGDGIPDHLDDCPLEPGPEEFNGCPDSDGDGIPDHLDDCPDVPGPKSNNGCPEEDVDDKDMGDLDRYSETIQFDLNKATIKPESYSALKSIGETIKKYSKTKFHLAGYTDTTGTLEFNNQLSKDRAASVKKYLVDKEGVDADQLTTEGYGPKNPTASNDTRPGREKNRRVHIILEKDRSSIKN